MLCLVVALQLIASQCQWFCLMAMYSNFSQLCNIFFIWCLAIAAAITAHWPIVFYLSYCFWLLVFYSIGFLSIFLVNSSFCLNSFMGLRLMTFFLMAVCCLKSLVVSIRLIEALANLT